MTDKWFTLETEFPRRRIRYCEVRGVSVAVLRSETMALMGAGDERPMSARQEPDESPTSA